MESAVRFIRLVQVAMLAGIVGSAVVGEFLRSAHPPDGTFFQILSLVAVSIVGATVVVRRTLVLPTEITLNRKPDDALAIAHWRGGYVLLYAMCEAIALLGLVLRLLDFPLLHVFGFYLGGFLLLLLFSPRPPERQFR